ESADPTPTPRTPVSPPGATGASTTAPGTPTAAGPPSTPGRQAGARRNDATGETGGIGEIGGSGCVAWRTSFDTARPNDDSARRVRPERPAGAPPPASIGSGSARRTDAAVGPAGAASSPAGSATRRSAWPSTSPPPPSRARPYMPPAKNPALPTNGPR